MRILRERRSRGISEVQSDGPMRRIAMNYRFMSELGNKDKSELYLMGNERMRIALFCLASALCLRGPGGSDPRSPRALGPVAGYRR